ncbi:MAG: glycosyltransferase family 1 protein, partial [Sphingobacteriaceae bacterium]
RERLQEFDPHMVHIATPSLLGEFGLKYANQEKLPVISIYHTHFISYIDYYLKSAPFLIDFVKSKVIESQRMFYNRCDMVYIPSESIATELMEIGISPLRMKIWKRGIDTQLFSPDKKDPHLMRRITGNNHPVVLFASRLVWEKNLETLFRIYDGLKLKNIPFNMVIAGDGTARKIAENRMPDAVFTGKVEHNVLAELYASASVFVFPSVSETYGNVILEAMASGLPCVIADGGGSADFIEQGVNGFKCDPYNEHYYIDKIIMLLGDKNMRKQFITEGLQYSKAFDWGQLAETYFKDVKKLAARVAVGIEE